MAEPGMPVDERRSIISITAIGLTAITAILIANAAMRGVWLDEFWSLQLSDLSRGFMPLVRDGWMHDTHPPIFNLWATILSALGMDSIPAGRLLTNVPALLAMVYAAWRFVRRLPDQYLFHAALLLLVLSVPATVEAFANYRSYFWQVAALTILVQSGRHIAMVDSDLRFETDKALAGITICASAASIMLHYIGGLFGTMLGLAILICAMMKGFRRWVWLLGTTMAASGLITIIFAWLAAGNWAVDLDHKWIQSEGGSALAIVIGLAARAVAHDPAPLLGLIWIRTGWHRRDTIFAATIVGALFATLLLLFLINADMPVIVGRYLVGLSVLICAVMAALAAKFGHEKALMALLAVMSVAAVAGPFLWRGPNPLWQANAGQIARIVARCPSTNVYAATGWLLRDGSGSRAARREDPVFVRGYRRVAASNGFTPQIIGRTGPTQATLGACPTLLWIEHVPLGGFDSRRILAAADLHGLEKAKLSLMRTESGLIVRADRQ